MTSDKRLRVLIVEDDPIVAFDLEAIITDLEDAEVAVCRSVDEARAALAAPVDFAVLDIDVVDGKSYPIAEALLARSTPIVFVSGARRDEVPPELRDILFIAKPYDPRHVERAFRTQVDRA